MLTDALLINGLVLFAVLESDLGPARKLSRFRLLRPLLLAGGIVPMFLDTVATRGNGLSLEVIGAVTGIAFGLIAANLIKVRYDHTTGKVVTKAGIGYAGFWTAVIAARSTFSIGATHWFSGSLTSWMTTHQIGQNALTDALIFMAVGMTVTRTLNLARRGAKIRHQLGTGQTPVAA